MDLRYIYFSLYFFFFLSSSPLLFSPLLYSLCGNFRCGCKCEWVRFVVVVVSQFHIKMCRLYLVKMFVHKKASNWCDFDYDDWNKNEKKKKIFVVVVILARCSRRSGRCEFGVSSTDYSTFGYRCVAMLCWTNMLFWLHEQLFSLGVGAVFRSFVGSLVCSLDVVAFTI